MPDRKIAALDRMIERHKNGVVPTKGRLFPSTLRLPADLDAAIDRLAETHHTKRSTVIKSLLRRALEMPEPARVDPLACEE